MTQLTIDVTEKSRREVLVAVAGEVDMATAPLLARTLRWYPDCDVVVDLSAVAFLDSAGLTALIQAHKRLRQTGHTLRTTGERDGALTVMRITGLLEIFHGT